MGQGDVAKILEKNYPKWMCVHDIKEFIDINETSIRRSLKCLESCSEIQVKIVMLAKTKRRQLTYYRYKNGK